MKKKTIWSLALALALVVSAIGTATSAFAATSAPMEPVTNIATESEDAIWEQIEAIEEKSDAIFQRNAALWESWTKSATPCLTTTTLQTLTKRHLSEAPIP